MLARRNMMIAAALAGAACGGKGANIAPPPHSAVAGDATWAYEVTLDPSGTSLSVRATFKAGAIDEGTDLSVTEGAEGFVRDLTSSRGSITARGDGWLAPGCSAGCTLSYAFALAEASRNLSSDGVASGRRGSLQSPPGAWLLRPMSAREADRFHLVVRTENGASFATGMKAQGTGFGGAARDLGGGPHSLFGELRMKRIAIGGSTLTLALDPSRRAATDDEFAAWAEQSGTLVANTFGRFPMDGALIGILPGRGSRVGFGRAFGGPLGASILVDVGAGATATTLREDWVLVHEMIHLGFPSLDRTHRWMEEGLATYLEPLIRARGGVMTDDEVWSDFVRMMPNGLPVAGDQGLDRTQSWGRLYWGGALFCFVTDVAIRRRTRGERSLDDALRAILAAGGHNGARWPIDRVFAVGDAATGATVLTDTYRAWRHAPVQLDLPAMFRDLGVRTVGDGAAAGFDDAAPLAAIRRQLTRADTARLRQEERSADRVTTSE